MENRFYVYEWYIRDTGEVFYVGKGTGNRLNELHNRNKYFNATYDKYSCGVRKIEEGLTNREACEREIERIAELWEIGEAKCNFTQGGTGFATGDMNPIHNRIADPNYINPFTELDVSGENNPFYGRKHTEETKKKISESRKGKGGLFGKDNPMYGKGWAGKDNPMYGKTKFKHPNHKKIEAIYEDGTKELMTSKEAEKKFGIAFTRIRKTGGTLEYKSKSKNSHYEGTLINIV